MEGIFIVYVVVHFTDRYLMVWVYFHFGWWFMGFPSWFGYRFDEGLVLREFSGHVGSSGGFLKVLFHVVSGRDLWREYPPWCGRSETTNALLGEAGW